MKEYDHSKGIDLRKPADIEAAKKLEDAFSQYERVTVKSLREREMMGGVYTRNYGVRYYYNNPIPVPPEVEKDMERNFDQYMIGEDTMGVYKIKTPDSVKVGLSRSGIPYERQVQKLEIQEQAHHFPWKSRHTNNRTGYDTTTYTKYITVRDPRSGQEVRLMEGTYNDHVRWDPDIRCYRQIVSSKIDGTIYSSHIIPEENYNTQSQDGFINGYDVVSDPGFSGAYIDPFDDILLGAENNPKSYRNGGSNKMSLQEFELKKKRKERLDHMMMDYGHLDETKSYQLRIEVERKERDMLKQRQAMERQRDDMDFWQI